MTSTAQYIIAPLLSLFVPVYLGLFDPESRMWLYWAIACGLWQFHISRPLFAGEAAAGETRSFGASFKRGAIIAGLITAFLLVHGGVFYGVQKLAH